MHGVMNFLDNLDPHKATGPDNMPTCLLKQFSPELSAVFTVIFSSLSTTCYVPADWKTANIVPVHKNGNRSIPSNYRPISLTSVCYKLLEHIIYTHIFLTLTNIKY